jgi:phosphate transport system protein
MTREHYDALLKQLDAQVVQMGELVADTIGRCVDALENHDVETAQRLIAADSRIDENRYDVEKQAIVLIATQQPMAGDLRLVAAVLTIATELERIGDYCEGIAALTLRMAAESPASQIEVEAGSLNEIRAMAVITQQLLRQALEAFDNRDVEAAGEVWMQDERVDALYEEVFRELLAEMTSNRTSIRRGTYLLWVAHNIERMADRVTNIAERVAFVVTGDVAGFRDRLRAQMLPA